MTLQRMLVALAMLLLALTGCDKGGPGQRETPPTELLQVKSVHGNVEGLGRMDEFMKRAVPGKSLAVRVTHLTVEGDPIDYEVYYDGQGSYRVRYDATKDKFGNGEVKIYSCGNFVKTETETSMSYAAVKCAEGVERIVVLDIGYDAAAQDRFEFVLQYGMNGEKTLRSSELSKRQLQEAYKALVLANYLYVKDLSAACQAEPNERYKLTVWINGSTRDYEWAACDNGADGKAMTAIAKRLLEMNKP